MSRGTYASQDRQTDGEGRDRAGGFELCLEVYKLCSSEEKIRLVPHLTHFQMRRDETLAILSLAIRAPQKTSAQLAPLRAMHINKQKDCLAAVNL